MNIILRPVTESDNKQIVSWRNDLKVRNRCFSHSEITEESNREFYKNNILTGKYKQFIVERIEDTISVVAYPIGVVYLKDLDYENKRCELCVFSNNDTEWVSECESIAIKILVNRAFSEYGMHKIYSFVFYYEKEELEILKSAGFSSEAILKEEVLMPNGSYEDVIRLSIINR